MEFVSVIVLEPVPAKAQQWAKNVHPALEDTLAFLKEIRPVALSASALEDQEIAPSHHILGHR